MPFPRALLLALLTALVPACADLSPRAAGVCGNGVLEAQSGEDCDIVGGPAASRCKQCRLTCTAATVVDDCGLGWGCGDDGLCRHAVGRFTRTPLLLREDALDFELADVDGDGLLDAFGYAQSRVFAHLGTPGGGFAGGLTVPNPLDYGPPGFGDFTGDGLPDAVTGGPRSLVLVVGGRPPAGFAVQPQPGTVVTTAQLVTRPIRTDRAPFSDLLIIGVESGVIGAFIQQLAADPPSPTPLATAPTTPGLALSDLPILLADLDGDDRDELLLETDDNVVHVFSTVPDLMGRPVLAPRAEIPLGADFASALFIADVTGDTRPDLIAAVDGDVLVAAADGAGGFLAPVSTPALRPAGQPPLALVDLDADGDTDLITSTGIYHRTGATFILQAQAVAPWGAVVVADFNYDDRLDVAALPLTPGLEAMLSAPGGGLYTRSLQQSDRGFLAIRAGDFDGDLFADVVLDTLAAGDDADHELVYLFGGPTGLAGELVPIGRFASVEGFEPAHIRIDDSVLTQDATSDLLVQARAPSPADAHDLMFFIGNADRFPVAPYDINRDPAAMLIGRFDAVAEADVLILYADETTAFVAGHGDGRLVLEDRADVTQVDVAPWCVRGSTLHGALVGDLDDDDQTDEIVGVVCNAGPGPRVQLARLGGSPGSPVLTATDLPLPAEAATLGNLASAKLVDLDHDGRDDLVLSFSGAGAASSSGLLVLWNGVTGLGASAAVLAADDVAGGLGSFAALEADGDPLLELFVNTVNGLLHVEVTDTRGLLVVADTEVRDITGVPRAGDLDGDGIDDLVVVSNDGLFVLLGCGHDDPQCQ